MRLKKLGQPKLDCQNWANQNTENYQHSKFNNEKQAFQQHMNNDKLQSFLLLQETTLQSVPSRYRFPDSELYKPHNLNPIGKKFEVMDSAWLWLTNYPVLRGDISPPPLALVMVLPASTLDPLDTLFRILWVYYKSASFLWNVSISVDNSML